MIFMKRMTMNVYDSISKMLNDDMNNGSIVIITIIESLCNNRNNSKYRNNNNNSSAMMLIKFTIRIMDAIIMCMIQIILIVITI